MLNLLELTRAKAYKIWTKNEMISLLEYLQSQCLYSKMLQFCCQQKVAKEEVKT